MLSHHVDLHFQSKSSGIRTINRRSLLLHLLSHGLVGDVKERTSLFEKSRRLFPVIVVWPEGDLSIMGLRCCDIPARNLRN